MATTLKDLLSIADAAVARGSSDTALKVILKILHHVADGTIIIRDAGDGLEDDIAHLESRSAELAEAGDAEGALKASRQAQMLKSATVIDAATETDEEGGFE